MMILNKTYPRKKNKNYEKNTSSINKIITDKLYILRKT
jgi:hypothetical protein